MKTFHDTIIIEYLERLEAGLKRQRLDKSGALMIAEQKSTHNIGEALVKPGVLAIVQVVLCEESER